MKDVGNHDKVIRDDGSHRNFHGMDMNIMKDEEADKKRRNMQNVQLMRYDEL